MPMSMPKIRYLLMNAYGVGGTIRAVVNQVNALAAAGHEIELVSVFRHRDEPTFAVDPRVRLVPLVDTRETTWRSQPLRTFLHRRSSRLIPTDEARYETFTGLTDRLIVDYLRSLRGGIVVGTRPALNLLIARFAPQGVVRVAQEHVYLRGHKPRVAAQIRRLYPALDAVVVLTEADEQAYRQALGDARVRLERIPNALPPGPRPRAPLTGKIVVGAGRLTKGKGFDLLIDAFEQVVARHQDWQLRIYGKGGQGAALSRRIHRRHLYNNVFLMGRTEQLAGELAKASVYALSSRFEGFGMVIVEAMSQGLPVVCFDCPFGPREIITHRHDGILVPEGDVPAFAAALEGLMDDRRLLRNMGAHAYDTATRYETSQILPRWEQLYEELSTVTRLRPVLL
jgi:glycosyltransferase involved in cell wall biosynthesis